MKTTHVCSLLALAAFLSAGCGKKDPAPPALAPTVIESLTPDQRARYCMVGVAQESDEAQRDFVATVQGTWVHIPATAGAGRREWMLDTARRILAVTTYDSIGHDVEDLTFKKTCVSAPLDPSYGAWAGYRVLEALADNNEGAAALLVRLDGSVLRVSDRYYRRFSQGSLVSLAEVLERAGTVWEYPTRL